MIGLYQPGVPAARSLLRDVVRHEAGVVGVYAKVVHPGRARLGDAVSIIEEPGTP